MLLVGLPIELCKDPEFMEEVVHVAQTGLVVDGYQVPPVKWGQRCTCVLPLHKHDCWKVASRVYKFSSDHFFHLYVHQMLAEGIFNMHDHNKMNVSAKFKSAGVNMKVIENAAGFESC